MLNRYKKFLNSSEYDIQQEFHKQHHISNIVTLKSTLTHFDSYVGVNDPLFLYEYTFPFNQLVIKFKAPIENSCNIIILFQKIHVTHEGLIIWGNYQQPNSLLYDNTPESRQEISLKDANFATVYKLELEPGEEIVFSRYGSPNISLLDKAGFFFFRIFGSESLTDETRASIYYEYTLSPGQYDSCYDLGNVIDEEGDYNFRNEVKEISRSDSHSIYKFASDEFNDLLLSSHDVKTPYHSIISCPCTKCHINSTNNNNQNTYFSNIFDLSIELGTYTVARKGYNQYLFVPLPANVNVSIHSNYANSLNIPYSVKMCIIKNDTYNKQYFTETLRFKEFVLKTFKVNENSFLVFKIEKHGIASEFVPKLRFKLDITSDEQLQALKQMIYQQKKIVVENNFQEIVVGTYAIPNVGRCLIDNVYEFISINQNINKFRAVIEQHSNNAYDNSDNIMVRNITLTTKQNQHIPVEEFTRSSNCVFLSYFIKSNISSFDLIFKNIQNAVVYIVFSKYSLTPVNVREFNSTTLTDISSGNITIDILKGFFEDFKILQLNITSDMTNLGSILSGYLQHHSIEGWMYMLVLSDYQSFQITLSEQIDTTSVKPYYITGVSQEIIHSEKNIELFVDDRDLVSKIFTTGNFQTYNSTEIQNNIAEQAVTLPTIYPVCKEACTPSIIKNITMYFKSEYDVQYILIYLPMNIKNIKISSKDDIAVIATYINLNMNSDTINITPRTETDRLNFSNNPSLYQTSPIIFTAPSVPTAPFVLLGIINYQNITTANLSIRYIPKNLSESDEFEQYDIKHVLYSVQLRYYLEPFSTNSIKTENLIFRNEKPPVELFEREEYDSENQKVNTTIQTQIVQGLNGGNKSQLFPCKSTPNKIVKNVYKL